MDLPRPGHAQSRIGSGGGLAVALLLAIVAAVVWTYPLVVHLDDSITTTNLEAPFDDGDQILSVWIVNEGGRRLYHDPLHVFDANIFHPMRHTLAYSESMLAAGAVVGPLHALVGNPILAFNLYYLATLVLSFLGVFLVVREITGDVRAGLLAGLLFAFSSDRWGIQTHLPAQAVQCIPWVFYFGIRCLSAPTARNLCCLGLALAANYHHSVYYGLTLPVLMVPWAAVLVASGRWPPRTWARIGGALGIASVASLVLYLPYAAVAAETAYAPLPITAVSPSWYWHALAHPIAYVSSLFTGGWRPIAASPVPILLIAVAGVASRRESRVPAPEYEALHGLAFLAFLLTAILLSLGGTIDAGIAIPGPFRLLSWLPGFSSLRTTSRLLVVATFGSTVLAGIAIATLLRRIPSRACATIVTAGIALAIAFDTRLLGGPWPVGRLIGPEDVPPVYRWLAKTPPDTAVLELPYGPIADDTRAMLFSTYHGRRLMNGYSARTPNFSGVLLRFPDRIAVKALQDAGVTYVLAHGDRLRSDPLAAERLAAMERRDDLSPRWIGPTLVLTIPPFATRPAEPRGRRLDKRGWRLLGNRSGAERAADGDLGTHWTAGIGRKGSFLRIDLGAPERLVAVVLRVGAHFLEYPGRYALWASLDGASWVPVGTSTPATEPPFASYRRDHLDVRVPLRMRTVDARYLEIRIPPRSEPPAQDLRLPARMDRALHEQGDPDVFLQSRWGVHEIEIYAAP